jgi:hypothetical protein
MNDEPSSPSPSASDVISALSRTGFILEYRAAQKLRTVGFNTSMNHAYPDPESGKSREMDVFAETTRIVKQLPLSVGIEMELIIECKNTTNPFVLIGESGQDGNYPYDETLLSFDPLTLEFPGKPHESVSYMLKLNRLSGSRKPKGFVGHQLVRMNRHSGSWKADNGSIYDSIIYPLAKAREHYIKDTRKANNDGPQWAWPYLTYILPIIVTAGPVITVDASDDEPTVSEVGWACLKREFSSEDLSGDLYADVVGFDQFEDYLNSRPLSILNAAEEILQRNIHLFDPEWLLANFGGPKTKDPFNEWLNDIRGSRKP